LGTLIFWRDARAVESGGLENRCPVSGPRVRIPLSPLHPVIRDSKRSVRRPEEEKRTGCPRQDTEAGRNEETGCFRMQTESLSLRMSPYLLGAKTNTWRGVRVVEGIRLESVCTLTGYRGFKSLPLRFFTPAAVKCCYGFCTHSSVG
jgi:hypothetical protein